MNKDCGFVQATTTGRGHTSELYLCVWLTQAGRTAWETTAVPILPDLCVCPPNMTSPWTMVQETGQG